MIGARETAAAFSLGIERGLKDRASCGKLSSKIDNQHVVRIVMLWWPFHVFVAGHIVFGAVGLVSFWPPVVGRKGSPMHRKWGKVFARCLLATGGFAIGISLCTLVDPLGTHPHLKDAVFVRSIFGVMMLYLATLTVNLAWYGLQCVANKRDHATNRRGLNFWLQPVLFVAALACAIEVGAWANG